MPEHEDAGARLRIRGRGDLSVAHAREFLEAIEQAYDGVLVFSGMRTRLGATVQAPQGVDVLGGWLGGAAPQAQRLSTEASVWPRDRLILSRVELHSPGFWEFVGSLNPLQVLRGFLQDVHERKKDRAYRNTAEKRRLNLENDLLEIKVIREQVALARDAGVPDEILLLAVNRLLSGPLRRLERSVDDGTIDARDVRVDALDGPA